MGRGKQFIKKPLKEELRLKMYLIYANRLLLRKPRRGNILVAPGVNPVWQKRKDDRTP